MRIIAGKFRGRKLKSPPSLQTRPTSDRLRETLFNILAPRIEGARLLDLCAGTGAVGIEALSRGAAHLTFVDRSRKMCALIEQNLDSLQIEYDKIEIIAADAFEYLQGYLRKEKRQFDTVFFDPPYEAYYEVALNFIGNHCSQILTAAAVVIIEHHKKRVLADQFNALNRYRELKQGDSVLSFYRVN